MAVLAGFLAYCVGPSLVGLRTLISVNLLSVFYPWIAAHGSDLLGHESCTGDTIDAVMPGIQHVRSELFAGHLANWQSVVGGGSALAGMPNLGLLDPISLPYWILPLWLAPAFVVLLQIVVAVGGTYLFLRQFRVSRAAGLLAGFVYATSGFMVVWTNWPQTRVAALIPALFWSVERLVKRRRVRDTPLIAVVVASMLLGGFPAVTGYALYMAAGYLIVRVVLVHRSKWRSAMRTVGLAAGGLVLGALLAMVQLLPFAYFYADTNLGYRTGDAKAGLPLSGLTTLFAPNSFGLCVYGHPYHGAVNPIELVAYVGAAGLVLAVAGAAFGPARDRLQGRSGLSVYFVVACVVIILLGWASPTMRSAVASLPVFAGNFIGRIRSVLGFGLAVLAAFGFDWMTAARDRPLLPPRPSRVVWPAVVVLGSIAAGVVILTDAHRAASSGGYETSLRNALVVPVVLVVLTAVLVLLARWNSALTRNLAFVVVPLLVVGQGAQFFHTVLPGDNPANFYPDTATHKFLAAHLGHDRFASSGGTMYPATALYYDLRTPTGHTFQETAWQNLLKAVDPAVMASPTFSNFTSAIGTQNIAHEPILDQMGVKYFVVQPTDLTGIREPLPAGDGVVTAGAGPGHAQPAVDCQLPAQAVRGVTFLLAQPLSPAGSKGMTLDVTVHDGSSAVSSGLYLGGGLAAGTPVAIPIAGESLPSSPGRMTVRLQARGARGPLTVTARSGSAVCAPVLPTNDGLRLVFADPGSIVYQRLTALARIRWASRSVTVRNPSTRVTDLKSGIPPDEVILDSGGPAASGRPATVSVLEDAHGSIAAKVAAGGGGYLVVADALQQPGWSVTVDGHKTALVPVDDAMAAAYVPAGLHTVRFTYTQPGQIAGLVVSGVAAVIILALLVYPVSVDRRRRRRTGLHRVGSGG